MSAVEDVAAALLYEGYLLWPYRRSATKNQQRWTLGGVYPRAFSEAGGGSDPWRMQTQCLVVGAAASLDVRVRFLQVVQRRVAERQGDGGLRFVDCLNAQGEQYLAWEEAREREVAVAEFAVASHTAAHGEVAIAEGEELEEVPGGALVRSWGDLRGVVTVSSDRIDRETFRVTVRIENASAECALQRDQALRHTLVSTHTMLSVREGAFVSLLDPPADLQSAARACVNLHTWPVLVGDEGDRGTMLSSPIILYDYPKIAPESRGDLFDSAEIDQLLALNILTLTDEEKQEMRATDPRARRILERTERLTADEFMALHGAIRERNAPGVRAGDRVRLRPRKSADVMDLVLAGKIGIIDSVEEDVEGRIHLAVVVEDDPGRDLGEARYIGHRFFFSPDEVEPVS